MLSTIQTLIYNIYICINTPGTIQRSSNSEVMISPFPVAYQLPRQHILKYLLSKVQTLNYNIDICIKTSGTMQRLSNSEVMISHFPDIYQLPRQHKSRYMIRKVQTLNYNIYTCSCIKTSGTIQKPSNYEVLILSIQLYTSCQGSINQSIW